MPITSEPAPSLRPWASATGATPLRTMFNLTCPPKCWVKIGHFYFAGNRTFLLCLDILRIGPPNWSSELGHLEYD